MGSRAQSPYMRTPSPLSPPSAPSPAPSNRKPVPASSPVLSAAVYGGNPNMSNNNGGGNMASGGPTGRSPRPLTPLPENCEIAIPPGAAVPGQFRPDTPVEQLEFHVSRKGSLSEAFNVLQSAPVSRVNSPAMLQTTNIPAGPGQYVKSGLMVPWEPQPQSPAQSVVSANATFADRDWERVPTPAPALSSLWNAAQGAHPMPGDGGISILNMYRQMPPLAPNAINALNCPEHFTFGPKLSQPFYTLRASQLSSLPQTYNELTLTRRSPLLGEETKVLNMQLPPRLPEDGLLTMIYPKRAVLAALARAPSQHPRDAIRAAADTECCKLIYSSARSRYELQHPAVATRNGEAVLVVKMQGTVGFDHLGAKGSIKLVNTTSQETLAAVDFSSGGRLLVNTNATSKIENQHIVDVAVGVVLCVAAIEGRKYREKHAAGSLTHTASPSVWSDKESETRSSSKRGNTPTAEAAAAAALGLSDGGGGKRGPQGRAGRWALLFVKGVGWILWFLPMLGWEIGKAIVLAFRDPDKPSKKSKSKR